jgi:hypothetical protein
MYGRAKSKEFLEMKNRDVFFYFLRAVLISHYAKGKIKSPSTIAKITKLVYIYISSDMSYNPLPFRKDNFPL